MMKKILDSLLPVAHCLDPEQAHKLALFGLSLPLKPHQQQRNSSLSVKIGTLNFAHPLGIAAGLDKNAQVYSQLMRYGAGHVEIGSVTPYPQPGNPKPRLFRLSQDRAIINRMGFNNDGHARVLERIQGIQNHGNPLATSENGRLGVNIGANKDSRDFFEDFRLGIACFAGHCDYITANVSSPNTPGLRDLQSDELIERLLQILNDERDSYRQSSGNDLPLFLKIAPDLDAEDVKIIVEKALHYKLDALIISNTTIARNDLQDTQYMNEVGGLSGRPLFEPSTRLIAQIYRHVGKDIPLIGVGGIENAATAIEKIEAGATLIQLYSALIYRGIGLLDEILDGLEAHIHGLNLSSINEVIGIEADKYADIA